MIYSHEVEKMCPVAQGVHHGAAQSLKKQNGYRANKLAISPV